MKPKLGCFNKISAPATPTGMAIKRINILLEPQYAATKLIITTMVMIPKRTHSLLMKIFRRKKRIFRLNSIFTINTKMFTKVNHSTFAP